jgi:hypothetical protein
MVSKVLAVIGSVPPVCINRARYQKKKNICTTIDMLLLAFLVLTFAFEFAFLSSAYAVAIWSDACGKI